MFIVQRKLKKTNDLGRKLKKPEQTYHVQLWRNNARMINSTENFSTKANCWKNIESVLDETNSTGDVIVIDNTDPKNPTMWQVTLGYTNTHHWTEVLKPKFPKFLNKTNK